MLDSHLPDGVGWVHTAVATCFFPFSPPVPVTQTLLQRRAALAIERIESAARSAAVEVLSLVDTV